MASSEQSVDHSAPEFTETVLLEMLHGTLADAPATALPPCSPQTVSCDEREAERNELDILSLAATSRARSRNPSCEEAHIKPTFELPLDAARLAKLTAAHKAHRQGRARRQQLLHRGAWPAASSWPADYTYSVSS